MGTLLEHLSVKKINLLTSIKWKPQELKNGEIYDIPIIKKIEVIMAGIFKGFVISYLFYENIMAVIVLIPYIYVWCRKRYKIIIEQKKRELTKQFKDGMTSVSFALNVGYSMENAFKESIQELIVLYGEEGDIVKIFKSIVYRIKRNEKLENILDEFAIQSNIDDIKYFSAVFRYAQISGGDLISIIKNTVRTIGEKIDTENEIQLVISGKKMEQRIMSMVPFGIIIYLKVTSPEFIAPLYGNLAGVMIMTVCLLMYMLSDWLAKRIVNIEV